MQSVRSHSDCGWRQVRRSATQPPHSRGSQMQAIDNDRRGHSGRRSEKSLSAIANFEAEMRAAVARYMREHPERLSERMLEAIIEALLYAFPCLG